MRGWWAWRIVLALAVQAWGCGYTVRPGSHTAGGMFRLGTVTVNDPDATLAADARASVVRALLATGVTSPGGGTVIDIVVTAPMDDAPPSILTATASGATATEIRATVRLRAVWTRDGVHHEVMAEGMSEEPVGTSAYTVGEANHLARRTGLDRAADHLAETLSDLGP